MFLHRKKAPQYGNQIVLQHARPLPNELARRTITSLLE